jgi:hypothetical protein
MTAPQEIARCRPGVESPRLWPLSGAPTPGRRSPGRPPGAEAHLCHFTTAAKICAPLLPRQLPAFASHTALLTRCRIAPLRHPRHHAPVPRRTRGFGARRSRPGGLPQLMQVSARRLWKMCEYAYRTATRCACLTLRVTGNRHRALHDPWDRGAPRTAREARPSAASITQCIPVHAISCFSSLLPSLQWPWLV